jgi:hypothetical protein
MWCVCALQIMIWDRIADCIVKCLIAAQPTLAHNYRASAGLDDDGFSCFEVLGFDIMLDSKLRPLLIEVPPAVVVIVALLFRPV